MGRRRKKRKIIEDLTITGCADLGKGLGRTEEGMVVFLENVAPGDVVDVQILRKKKKYAEGVVIEYKTLSEERAEPFCEHYGTCGGCKWQHLQYDTQLKWKQEVVENTITRIGKVEVGEMLPIVGSEKTTFYRNKMDFSFANKRWLTRDEIDSGITNKAEVLGFHPRGGFDKVLDIHKCWLQDEPSNAIRNACRTLAKATGLPFYDIKANKGYFRNVMVRTSTLGQTMVVLTFKYRYEKVQRWLMDSLLEQFPQITSLHYCINPKMNDFIMDLPIHTYHGDGHIFERLGAVEYKISPKSFFQTNPTQAKVLYDLIAEFAGLQGEENVYDLYTGTGSIALYLAQYAKQVVGIEEIEAAIIDAEFNKRRNNIDNAIFYAGDVKNILTQAFANKHGKPDVVITDPPRAGMHGDVVQMLLDLAAPKIVYVSCKASTQARDLNILKEKYEVVKLQPVDMFPHTYHVETVALLKLRE